MNNKLKDTVVKSIRLDTALCEKIQAMADKNQRDFTKQVRWMLEEYIRIKEDRQ